MTSINIARLDTPYLGAANLAKLGPTIIEGKNDTGNFRVLEFDFALDGIPENNPYGLPPVKKGIHHIHTEWQPKGIDPETPGEDGREPDSEEKVQNMFNRIGYMLKYFLGEELAEKVTNVEGETYPEIWDSLLKRVEAVVKQKAAATGMFTKPIEIKIIGEVYQGDGRVNLTKYVGFLADQESGEALTFSKGEKAKNREYLMWKSIQDNAQKESSDDFDSPVKTSAPGESSSPNDVIF